MADSAEPMQPWKAFVLFLYLLIIGGLMVYCVYGLWAAESEAVQWKPAAEPTYTDDENPKDDTPKIKLIDPQQIPVSIGQTSIQIFGYNFTEKSQVRFNGASHAMYYVNEHKLVVPLEGRDVAAPGVIVITVANGDKSSNAETMTVQAVGSSGVWRVFGWSKSISKEVRLILLVLFTGAFGA
jgi:hypothetical protein